MTGNGEMMNRREAIKTIGSFAGIATTVRLVPGCLRDDSIEPSVKPVETSGPAVESAIGIISSDSSWGTSWTHVVPGRWSGSPYDGLLLYSQGTGTAAFYDTDGTGQRVTPALQIDTWWRQSWTIVKSGFFTSSRFSCVLLYDQAAGYLAIFSTDGAGNISRSPIMERDTRATWTHIVPGWFVEGSYSSILLYSQSEGYAEVWKSDGTRTLSTVKTYSGWRTSWTKIVAGPFGLQDGDYALTDVVFYEGSSGHAERWNTDGTGAFSYLGAFDGLPTNVADVFAANFASGLGIADLAFLGGDGLAPGTLVFRRLPVFAGETELVLIDDPATYLRPDSSIVVAGNFFMADVEDRRFSEGPVVANPTRDQELAIQNWRGSVGGFKSFVAYARDAGVAECMLYQPNPDTSSALEGYATSTTNSAGATVSTGSVLPGETVSFCVSSGVGAYTIEILSFTPTGVMSTGQTITGLPEYPTPVYRSRLSYRDGPSWSPVGSFTVPTSWSSGVYVAKVTSGEVSIEIPFIVRSPSPGTNKILVVIPDATYEAYNIWGGRSFYGFLATPGNYGWSAPGAAPQGGYGPYAFKVCFDRAYQPVDPDPATSITNRKWLTLEANLVQWLKFQQLDADYCTCRDLDRMVPSNAYKAVVFAGHHEYWSAGMRDNVQAYNNGGGNTVFLSGNTCWFQVRFDYIHNQMICYKVAEFDPWYATSASRYTTTNWHLSPVNDPSPRTTGLMWSKHLTPPISPSTPLYEFKMVFGQDGHWVYKGTELLLHTSQDGAQTSFGAYFDTHQNLTDSIANGAELDCVGGSCLLGGDYAGPRVTSLAEVLWECRAGSAGAATMCVFNPTPNSQAFNAATFKWCRGLSVPDSAGYSTWTAMDQITLNVFDQFLGRQNLAAGCPITASSSHEQLGWSAQNLTDGNLLYGYSSEPGEVDPSKYSNHVEWVWVQLSSSRLVSQVVLYPRRHGGAEGWGFPVSLHIDVWNGTTWLTRVTKTALPTPGTAPQVFAWGHSDTTNYVRVRATSLRPTGNDGYLFQLAELRIY